MSATAVAPSRDTPRLRSALALEWRPGYASGVAALTAVGLTLRLAFAGQLPFWRDEAFTAVVAGRSWTGMLDAVRHDSAPPLGYLLSHVAATLSSSPASLRLVPGLAGTAMIPIAAALARRAGGTRAGLYGAATVAVLPELVHLSRDARMYALAGTLVTACSLALWRAVERPSVGRLSVLAACVALAVHTQYFAALAVAVQLAAAAMVLRAGRSAMRRAAAAAAAGGLTLVPWLIAASAQFQHNQTPFWMSRVTAASLGDAAADLFQGDAAAGTQLATRTLQDLCIGIAALAGLVVLVVALRTPWPRFRPTAYLAIAGLGAMAALVALSLFRPLFDPRYLSVLWGPSLPLLGIGLARLRPLGSLAVLVLAAATVAMLVTTTRADWRETAGWLNARLERSDQVVINSPDYLVLLHYGNDRLVAATHVLNSGGPPWFWGTAAYPRGALVRRVVDANGTIYVFAGDFVNSVTRLVLPPGYRPYHPRCDSGICVTPYRR